MGCAGYVLNEKDIRSTQTEMAQTFRDYHSIMMCVSARGDDFWSNIEYVWRDYVSDTADNLVWTLFARAVGPIIRPLVGTVSMDEE